MIRIHPLLCALLFAATPAAAQRTLALGQPVEGELSATDPTRAEGEHYDAWTFRPQPGVAYRIVLESEDFDAYLLAGPRDGDRCDPCFLDDDGWDGTDAALSVTTEDDETFVVMASSLDAGETGRYTLAVEESPADSAPATMDTVAWTDPVMAFDTSGVPPLALEGVLEEADLRDAQGVPYDSWTYTGHEGETVTFALDSEDFDPVLRVGRMEGGAFREMWSNDDGPDGTGSVLTLTFENTGKYELRVTAYEPDQFGRYTLSTASDVFAQVASEEIIQPSQSEWFSGTVSAGEAIQGTLVEGDLREPGGALEDLWAYQGTEGEMLTLTMTSTDFDTYLRVLLPQPDGTWLEVGANDDDGGGGTNSAVTVTLPANSLYLIGAAALLEGQGGAYVLSIVRN